jgi:Fungal Zn(2)-Cys(6) binuclear cluster domain
MPRPKKEGAAPPKTRSRFGCWPCKTRKVKCGEEKPVCKNCQRQGEKCDYSIRLNWDARPRTKSEEWMNNTKSLPNTPNASTIVFPSPDVFSGPSTPGKGQSTFSTEARKAAGRHGRSRSNVSTPVRDIWQVDSDPQKRKIGSASPGLLPLDTGVQNGNQSPFSAPHHRSALSIDLRPQHLSPSWSAMTSAGASMTGGPLISDADSSVPLFPSYNQSIPTSSPSQGVDSVLSADRSKRMRLSGPSELSSIPLVSYEAPLSQSAPLSPNRLSKSPRFGTVPPALPVTPGSTTISPGSEEQGAFFSNVGPLQTSQLINDPSRRVSVPVSSLLTETKSKSQPDSEDRKIEFKPDACQSFGYDRGRKDLDFPKNDDNEALVASPDITNPPNAISFHPVTINFDAYYAKPVRIDIPLMLLPLPESLQSNPMNLLYFHHFINHTARILTPHDCLANPYRTVLPQSKS